MEEEDEQPEMKKEQEKTGDRRQKREAAAEGGRRGTYVRKDARGRWENITVRTRVGEEEGTASPLVPRTASYCRVQLPDLITWQGWVPVRY